MTISRELLDELLSGVERPEDLLGDKGLMKELKVRLMERMLGAELTGHLGYEPHGERPALSEDRISELCEKRGQGILIKDLMAHYDLSKATIYRYLGTKDT